MIRLPVHCQEIPAPGEVRRVLRDGKAAVAGYIVPPGGQHSANSWLYVCADPTYSPAKLHETVRRHIGRAEAHLAFSWLDEAALLDHGYPPFRDARRRNALSDCTEADFRDRFKRFLGNPAQHALGAWHDGVLVAFMACTVVEDWVDIGGFSMDDDARMRANNGLVHRVLTHFLVERGFRMVSYGLSSVQDGTGADGLHRFKLKAGFQAVPVARVFEVHPLARPVVNRVFLRVGRVVLRAFPGNRSLRKAIGVLARLVEGQKATDAWSDGAAVS